MHKAGRDGKKKRIGEGKVEGELLGAGTGRDAGRAMVKGE